MLLKPGGSLSVLVNGLVGLLLGTVASSALACDYRLVGEAELKFMFWSVYHSRLYSADGDYREGQLPLRMEIEYLLPVKRDALVVRTAKEWEQQGLLREQQEAWLQQLAQLWPDIEKRDVLALEVDTKGVSTFFHNDQPLGSITDQAFAGQFLGIWLSPQTSRPDFRKALLGGP